MCLLLVLHGFAVHYHWSLVFRASWMSYISVQPQDGQAAADAADARQLILYKGSRSQDSLGRV